MSHEQHGHDGDGGKPKEPIGWMDRPDLVKRLFMVFYVLCGILFVAEWILGRETEHAHPWEWFPLFYVAYGFVSFWFLVLVAKQMRRLLIRSEDYYDAE